LPKKALQRNASKPITISGNSGNDAKYYQERAVKIAIKESKK
jgi:hypothetical protein